MKQIVQHLDSGETELCDLPVPSVKPDNVLIRAAHSLVSAGTERMLLDFSKASWIEKARLQPDRVEQVLYKMRTDGWKTTLRAVNAQIKRPIPLGYAQAGTVIAVGENVRNFKVGDRVASNGAHAEFVSVPHTLCAKIPDNVTTEQAAYTVVGAVALQGIRVVAPAFGETVLVVGLGLIGQIAVQLLKANGCIVYGVDPQAERCALAQQFGAIILPGAADDKQFGEQIFTHSKLGVDAVLIAAADRGGDLISEAAKACRKGARIVMTGVSKINIDRTTFYKKELSFAVSTAYGPGRYDYNHEEKGLDYAPEQIRWTAARNMEAVLQAMSAGTLNCNALTGRVFEQKEFAHAYHYKGTLPGVLFTYPQDAPIADTVLNAFGDTRANADQTGMSAILGTGKFAQSVLVPKATQAGFTFKYAVSQNGLSAGHLAKTFKIPFTGVNPNAVLEDASVDFVFIATPHHLHADMIAAALRAGKHVFCEKPLALHAQDLHKIINAATGSKGLLHAGFNRRFSPLAEKMRALAGGFPLNIVMTVNAGKIESGNWLSDREKSGGRIIGEVCHFIDLAVFLCAAQVLSVTAQANAASPEDVSLLLEMADGSHVAVHYFTNGSKQYDKERVDVYSGGRTLVLENWRKLSGYGFSGFSSMRITQDKGHAKLFATLAEQGRTRSLIPFAELMNVSAAAIAAEESLRSGALCAVNKVLNEHG